MVARNYKSWRDEIVLNLAANSALVLIKKTDASNNQKPELTLRLFRWLEEPIKGGFV